MTRLDSVAWTDLRNPGSRVLLLPLGSTEQHGPHLPFGTDTLIAEAIANELAAQRPDIVIAPTLPYGSSGEHGAFAGTLSLATGGLELALLELVRSANEFRGVLLFSWHGGNAEAIDRAVEQLRQEQHRIAIWRPPPAKDAHAGWTETSLVLALAPHHVSMQSAEPGATEPLEALMPRLCREGVAAVSPNGVLGDPRGATAEAGRAILAHLVADLANTYDNAFRHATIPVR